MTGLGFKELYFFYEQPKVGFLALGVFKMSRRKQLRFVTNIV